MDFFDAQAVAQKNTRKLVGLFAMAVLGVMVAVYAAAALCLHMAWVVDTRRSYYSSGHYSARSPWNGQSYGVSYSVGGGGGAWWTHWIGGVFHPLLALGTVVVTLAVIALAAAYRTAALARGGEAVALAVGGRRVQPNTTDVDERRLLNVVEEMAIASGIPAPPVYVLDDERAINAFAAGHAPADAVVTVTRGTLRLLSRDELQGVIGHEFSHILHGDMRLNLRLVGWVYGITGIAMVGYGILRALSGPRRVVVVRSRNGKGGGGIVAFFLFGALLIAIGAVGMFFGNLIRAAVSRQREFLADASSVQYTRNPGGIAGALRKIGGLVTHSTIDADEAHEFSHMFFGQAFASSFAGLFDTHPPLAERLRRIDPMFDGKFPPVEPLPYTGPEDDRAVKTNTGATAQRYAGRSELQGLAHASVGDLLGRRQYGPAGGSPGAAAAGRIGRPGVVGSLVTAEIMGAASDHLAYATHILGMIPPVLRQAAREPDAARGVVWALLLSDDDTVRQRQLAVLWADLDMATRMDTERCLAAMSEMDTACLLPLLDSCLPTLRQLSPAQYQDFRRRVRGLIEADGKVSLLEWMIHKVLLRHLDSAFGDARPVAVQYQSPHEVADQAATLLRTMAWKGTTDTAKAQRAYLAGQTALGMALPALGAPAATLNLAQLDQALDELAKLAPAGKKRVLEALTAAVWADGQVTTQEAELYRAATACLGVPAAPLWAGDRR